MGCCHPHPNRLVRLQRASFRTAFLPSLDHKVFILSLWAWDRTRQRHHPLHQTQQRWGPAEGAFNLASASLGEGFASGCLTLRLVTRRCGMWESGRMLLPDNIKITTSIPFGSYWLQRNTESKPARVHTRTSWPPTTPSPAEPSLKRRTIWTGNGEFGSPLSYEDAKALLLLAPFGTPKDVSRGITRLVCCDPSWPHSTVPQDSPPSAPSSRPFQDPLTDTEREQLVAAGRTCDQ